MSNEKKISKRTGLAVIAAIIAFLVLGGGLYYLLLPALSIKAASTVWAVVIYINIAIMIYALIRYWNRNFSRAIKIALLVSLGMVVIVTLLSIISSPIVQAKKYQNVAKVEEKAFEEDFKDIDSENMFIVDVDSARRVGDRVIGNLNHSSWFEVDDEYNLINYKEKLYRISALNYGGGFKFFKAKEEGIPGYVLVDANTMEASFVESKESIKYSPSAMFSHDLKRHLRHQYKSYIFDKSFIEIDEKGNPYWITGVKKPTAVWGAKRVDKVILTNASTGESQELSIEDVPKWVDHVLSLDYLNTVASNHFRYVNGFFNPSMTGVFRTSYYFRDERDDEDDETANYYGYNSFITKNGEVSFFTGLTPANNSESNVGFLSMNTRTGQIVQYSAAGAEESSAQKAAEGKVENFGYKATYPTVVNVAGNPTYFMALKDKSGMIQRYALVNISNYAIGEVAETIDGTLEAYRSTLGVESKGKAAEENLFSSEGVIESINTAIIDGTTYYYYVVDQEVYKASIKVFEKQVLFKVGDTIKFTYEQNSDGMNVIKTIS